MPNLIYRGPHDKHPRTVSEKAVAGAYLPGTFVTEGATTLTQAVAPAGRLRLLAHRDYYVPMGAHFDNSDPLKTAYAVGDSGVAYVLEPGQQYQAAMAAGTYAVGQALTVGAAGRLAAAAAGNVVVAFADKAATVAAGDLLDVEIANFYTAA
ncbi:hypothetical protein [Comamonas testosteroni]|uniref:hypothetical protein n=1 Tax=Comamonas testosteroni TaxID=285 RepID=UPI0006B9D4EA|nr:hypothetical protein [Comamonas testosteroni]